MRKLSDSIMQALKEEFLAGITQKVIEDKDLDLQNRSKIIIQ
jgi:hypothetical protein